MGEPHTTFPRCPLPHPHWRGAIAFSCCFGCSLLARFPRGRVRTWCRVTSYVRHPAPCARPPPRLLASARALRVGMRCANALRGSLLFLLLVCSCVTVAGAGPWGAGSALPLPLPPHPPPPCAVCPALVAFRLRLRFALSPLPLVGGRMRAAIAFSCCFGCSRLARNLGAGRAHGVGCRPASDTRHHARAHPLGSLRRLALGLDRLRCAYARPSCRPAGAARPPCPGFAPHPVCGGLCGERLRRNSSGALWGALRHPLLRAGKYARAPSWVSIFSLSAMVQLSLQFRVKRSTHARPAGALRDALRAPDI